MQAKVAKNKADLWAIARGPSISVPMLTLLRRGPELFGCTQNVGVA